MRISRNRVVALQYRVQLADGTVVDESEPGSPLTYLHGHGQIVPGLERALEGMQVGEAAQIELAPGEAYGERDIRRVQEVPTEAFPSELRLEPGMMLHAETAEGEVMPFIVLEVREGTAVIDLNHPLAGHTLRFDITVSAIRDASAEELAHGHVHVEERPGAAPAEEPLLS